MKTTPCRGCGKPIVWGVTHDGKRIPLDPRPAVYIITTGHVEGESVRISRTTDAMVGHHATCPNAGDFSGLKKKAATLEAQLRTANGYGCDGGEPPWMK